MHNYQSEDTFNGIAANIKIKSLIYLPPSHIFVVISTFRQAVQFWWMCQLLSCKTIQFRWHATFVNNLMYVHDIIVFFSSEGLLRTIVTWAVSRFREDLRDLQYITDHIYASSRLHCTDSIINMQILLLLLSNCTLQQMLTEGRRSRHTILYSAPRKACVYMYSSLCRMMHCRYLGRPLTPAFISEGPGLRFIASTWWNTLMIEKKKIRCFSYLFDFHFRKVYTKFFGHPKHNFFMIIISYCVSLVEILYAIQSLASTRH